MTEISKEILEKYQVRKTKAQKLEFIEFMRAHFPKMTVEEGGFIKNRNLVIGDLSSAKVVLTAHYDTCAVMPVPNFIMPKKPLLSLAYGFVIAIPMLAAALLIGWAVGFVTQNPDISRPVYLIAFWAFLLSMFIGKPNKHTVNDNTSGVITLVELLSTLPEENSDVCFVFFDNEENGLLGSSFFAKKHKEEMADKLLINFDCVSDGDNLMFILNKRAYPEYAEALKESFDETEGKTVLIEKEKGTYYPSDQKNFKKNMAVAALKNGPFGLYMDRIHTPRDTVMDERNIEMLISGIQKFISKL